MDTTEEPIYLSKSAKFYKIYGGLFLFSIAMTVARPFFKKANAILDLLIGLPMITVFIMAPIGLFYSWKSYQRKEGQAKSRFRYFIGHLFFCLLVLVLITAMIKDFSQLF